MSAEKNIFRMHRHGNHENNTGLTLTPYSSTTQPAAVPHTFYTMESFSAQLSFWFFHFKVSNVYEGFVVFPGVVLNISEESNVLVLQC